MIFFERVKLDTIHQNRDCLNKATQNFLFSLSYIVQEMDKNTTESFKGVEATLNYLASSVEPSLFRNGKVGTKRALTGDDHIWFNNTLTKKKVFIHNARENPDISLNKEGFELHQNDIPSSELDSIYFRNFHDVVTRYELLKNIYPLFYEYFKSFLFYVKTFKKVLSGDSKVC